MSADDGVVAIIRWPEEAASVERLRSSGTPRLLLVAPDATAPGNSDCDEDWIRLPADDADVRLRAATLAVRASRHGPRPEVKGDGRIVYRGKWAPLSDTEESMARVLCERYGEVVDPHAIEAAGWGDDPPTSNAVRVHITRLRKRILPLGLVVRTVHGRGWVLEGE